MAIFGHSVMDNLVCKEEINDIRSTAFTISAISPFQGRERTMFRFPRTGEKAPLKKLELNLWMCAAYAEIIRSGKQSNM